MFNKLILLVLLYIQYILPIIHSSITLTGNFTYTIFTQNICSNAFITIPLCIGDYSPITQCFNLIFNINGKYIMLINTNIDSINGFNSSLSSTYSKIQKTIFIHNINNIGKLSSFLIKDSIYIKELNSSISKVSMLELNEIDFTYPHQYHSGLIGFNFLNEMGDDFLYLKHLISNQFIPSMNYYYTFISTSQVNITIGIENTDPIINTFSFCKNPSTTYNYHAVSRKCKFTYLKDVHTGNIIKQLEDRYNEVVFNTLENGIYVPGNIGKYILEEYVKAANGKCEIVTEEEGVNKVKCDRRFNYEILPVFMLEGDSGVQIKLFPVDLFNYTSGESLLKVKKYLKEWIFDLNVLKHYDIFVYCEDDKIGFKENGIFLNKKEFMLRYYNNETKVIYIQNIIKSMNILILSGLLLLLLTALFLKE